MQVQAIIVSTARQLGVSEIAIRDGRYKRRDVTYARHMAIYVAQCLTFLSNAQISLEFGLSKQAVGQALKAFERVRNLTTTQDDIRKILRDLR